MKSSVTFAVGQQVQWTSQSRGSSTTKSGVVVAVVPPGKRPSRSAFPDLYRGAACGLGRKHESYVVRVGHQHYWPRVSGLSQAPA